VAYGPEEAGAAEIAALHADWLKDWGNAEALFANAWHTRPAR
jgi:hypothetical protein